MKALAKHGRAYNPWEVDPQALASLLKLCDTAMDGTIIHALIAQSPLHADRFLANMLADMYGQCGALDDAMSTFASILLPNVFSWNIIIRACVSNGHALRALSFFNNMLHENTKPDRVTFLSALSACAHLKDLQEARKMEACIAKSNVSIDVVIESAMINMYYKCGSLEDAERIFSTMQDRDVVCWNTMIAAYSQHAQGKKALILFQKMVLKGIDPSQATYGTLFNLCADEGLLDEGRHLHTYLKRSRLALDVTLGNALICMYGKCNSLKEAHDVFESMCDRNSVTWSAMMFACITNGCGFQAIHLFDQMLMEGLVTDTAIITNGLCACASVSNLAAGKQFHACLSTTNLISDVIVSTALVNMYGKCQRAEYARDVFDQLSERDMVAHNAVIAAYSWCGRKKEVIQHFQQMQLECVAQGRITFASSFDACGMTEGKFMHVQFLSNCFNLDNDTGSALISMYGKHGNLKQAEIVLDELCERDVVAWNALISTCGQLQQYSKAFQYFQQLQLESFTPSAATFASTLSACVTRAALTDGKQIHSIIVGTSLESDVIVATAIINMYAKCGSLESARMVFDGLLHQTGITWNALVAAYAQHGESKEALRLFNVMLSKGMCVDKATFSSVLSACSRAGYVDEGVQCFISMLQSHGIRPTIQHYNCLIDLVSRAGRLEEGESVMNLMPARPIDTSWTALLGSCRTHLDFERGKRVASSMSKKSYESDSIPMLLINILALANGRRNEELAEPSVT